MNAYDDDLELARQCAAGDEAAWERFIRDYRPILYRAADALDPAGGARDLADALYGELYGVRERDGERQSLFRYFHGRSSLATWLRAVLAQRFVDRQRAGQRLRPLPPEREDFDGDAPSATEPDPERVRFLALVQQALGRAIGRLSDRDRLRLGCYYVQELTLAETGRVLHEHEATASRQLARTRRDLRAGVERALREDAGLGPAQVARCLELAAEDPGPLDLGETLGSVSTVGPLDSARGGPLDSARGERKKSAPDRSL